MAVVTSFNKLKVGKLGYNDFTAADDTTHIAALGTTPLWSLVTGAPGIASYIKQSGLGAVGIASYNGGVTDMVAWGNLKIKTQTSTGDETGLVVRVTNGTNFYVFQTSRATNPTVIIYKYVAGVQTQLAISSALGMAGNTWYSMQFRIKGSVLTGMISVAGVVTTITATDGTFTSPTIGGAWLYGANVGADSECEALLLTSSSVITITGLLNGQKFKIYKGGVLIATSTVSANGTATVECLGIFPNPPYDQIMITDVDGGTVIYPYNSPGGIYPGDVFQATAVVVSNDATAPYLGNLLVNVSRLGMIAKSGAYSDFVDAEVSPPAPNTIGQFDVWIPDPLGNEAFNFPKGTPVWFYGVVGPYFGAPLIVGLVDRVTPHRLPGGVQLLEIAGQDWAAGWLNLHGYAATTLYQNVNAATVLGSDIAQLAPEVQIGPSLIPPSTQITSDNILVSRSGWDVSIEFSILSSSDRVDWAVYGCQGQHIGEHKPNLHLSPMSQGASPIPILTSQTFKLLAPDDRRQIITLAAVHFSYNYTYDSSDTVFIYSGLRTMIRTLPNIIAGGLMTTMRTAKIVTLSASPPTIDNGQSPPFGTGVGKFVAASSQYIALPDSTDWAFGVADSTILDCWVKFNSLPTNGNTMYLWRQRQDASNTQAASIYNNAGTYQLVFFASSGGSTLINSGKNSSPNLATGIWYHLVIVRSGGNTFRFFQGGTSLGTTSNSSTLPDNTATLNIGGVTSGFLDGWIKEFRISNTARWTSNFTPPSKAYDNDAYTVLLLHMETAFLDDAGLRFASLIPPTYSSQITSTSSYAPQTGDCLEYDVYLQSADSRLFVDLALSVVNPFNNTSPYYVGYGGSAATPTSARVYTVNEPIVVTIGAGSGQTITTKDASGNIIDNAAATLNQRLLGSGYTLTVTFTGVGAVTITQPLSQAVGAYDQRGILVYPDSTIGNVAVGQWYHRRIPLPVSWVGGTISAYVVQNAPVSAGDYVDGLRHIYITNGGTSSTFAVNKVIWDGDGTAIFGNVRNVGCTQITASVGSPVTTISFPYVGFGHPIYGTVPKLENKEWMTSAQAAVYGGLVCKNLADGYLQLQAWMPLDGRFAQGQYVPIWDALSWGNAILQNITYDFTRRVMELNLQIMDDRNKKLLTVRG